MGFKEDGVLGEEERVSPGMDVMLVHEFSLSRAHEPRQLLFEGVFQLSGLSAASLSSVIFSSFSLDISYRHLT